MPVADEVEDDPLEDRPAGDPEHRLGDGVRQRPQPTPWPPAMTTAQFVASDGLEELVEQVQAGRAAVRVDHRDRADPAGAHQLDRLGTALALAHGDECAGE